MEKELDISSLKGDEKMFGASCCKAVPPMKTTPKLNEGF